MKTTRVLFLAATTTLLFTGCHRTPRYGDVIEESYVHRYGVEVPAADWAASGQNGQVITKLANGVIVAKTYKDGSLEGCTTCTFPHSDTIEKVETYACNTLEKEVLHYYSGTPRKEVVYGFPNKRTVTCWLENGSPVSREEFQNNRLMTGEYYNSLHQVESTIAKGQGKKVSRDQYGQIASVDTYDAGEMVMRSTFHPNGAPKEIMPYRNGYVEGELKYFLPGGEPERIETWTAGEQTGITIVFKNGEKYAEVPYVRGKKNGVEQRFRSGALVVEEVTWVNDQMHGPSKVYIGDAIKTDWYYRDRLVGQNSFDQMSRPRPS